MPEFVGSLVTPRLSAAPSSPVAGQMYYDTTQQKLFWWNGTTWISASGNGGGGAGGGHTIQDEGASFTQRSKLNFTGAGVSTYDDGATLDTTRVEILGGSQAYAQILSGYGTTVNAAQNTWTFLPLMASGVTITSTANRPDFELMADGSIRIVNDGFYEITGSGAMVDPVNAGVQVEARICATVGTTPGFGDWLNVTNEYTGLANAYVVLPVTASRWLTANTRVGINIYHTHPATRQVKSQAFSIHRTGQGPVGPGAGVAMDYWHKVGTSPEPVFQNSWAAYDSDVYFRKDPLGRVWLRGSVNGGANATVAFTLPVGYRPALVGLNRTRNVSIGNQTAVGQWEAQVNIGTDGAVTCFFTGSAATSFISLDQISFDTGTVTTMPTGPAGPQGLKGDPGQAIDVYAQVVGGTQGTSVNNGAWTLIQLPPTPTITSSDGTNPDFVRNADGSLTVLKAGNYSFACTVQANTPVPDNTNVEVRLCRRNGMTPDQTYWAATSNTTTGSNVGSNSYTGVPVVCDLVCAAGDRIAAFLWQTSGATTTFIMKAFSCTRAGAGPQGPPGGTMGASYARYKTTQNIANGGSIVNLAGWVRQSDFIDDTAYSIIGATIAVRDAGLYEVKLFAGALGGTVRSYFDIIGPASEVIAQFNGVYPATTTGEASVISAFVLLPANGAVLARGYQEGAAGNWTPVFSIARVGGPKGDKGDVGATGGNASATLDTWHVVGGSGEPAFQNGWAQQAGRPPLSFTKDPFGQVTITGEAGGGTAGQVMFVLPAAYRPTVSATFACLTQGGTVGYFNVSTNGNVAHGGGVDTTDTAFYCRYDTGLVTSYMVGPTGPQGPAGTVPSLMAFSSGWGPNVSTPISSWVTLQPMASPMISPAGAFIFAADYGVQITETGWYDCHASVYCSTANITMHCTIGSSPAAVNYGAETYLSLGSVGGIVTPGGALYITAGQKIYVTASTNAAATVNIREFTITRIGGPKGDKGDPASVNAASYRNARTANGPTLNATVGGWQTIDPRVSGQAIIEPTAAFTENSDFSVSVRDAGWYAISFTVVTLVNYDGTLTIRACNDTSGTVVWCQGGSRGSTTRGCQSSAAAGGVKLAAGEKVYLQVISDTTSVNCAVAAFSIARVGGPTGPQGPPGNSATVPMDTWHAIGTAGEPTFQNSWANQGGTYTTAAFRKFPDGKVRIRGLVNGGTYGANTVIFTLPAGYRPVWRNVFDAISNNAAPGRIDVDTNGSVIAYSGTTGYLALDGIEFDTETVTQLPTGPKGDKGDPGASTSISFVSTLPPVAWDGLEIYYQNTAMAAKGIVWHLRYNANSTSAYKWEFLGGPDWLVSTTGGITYTTGAGSYVFGPAMAAPQITLPLNGDFFTRYSVNAQVTSSNADIRCAAYVGGINNSGNGTMSGGIVGSLIGMNFAYENVATGRTASEIVDLRMASMSASLGFSVFDRFLSIAPVRVG